MERDTEFNDLEHYRSGGIRLHYESTTETVVGLKEGILLEVGFDDVTPNWPKSISSWAYDYAAGKVDIMTIERSKSLATTPVIRSSKNLQTISTKFSKQQETGEVLGKFHAALLRCPSTAQTSGRIELHRDAGIPSLAHKKRRFRKADNPDIPSNEAFVLKDPGTRAAYE